MAKFIYKTPDWEERILSGKSPTNLDHVLPLLNKKRTDTALKIFNNLRLHDVPNQPHLSEACGEWFKNIVAVAAGSLSEDGEQRTDQLLVEVAKKNSKTSYSALLALTIMMISPRPRAVFLFEHLPRK